MARVENVYLFAGSNEWEKAEALRELKVHLFPDGPSSVECEVIDGRGKDLNPEKVLSDLVTIPFESRRRFILIKDVEKTPPTFQSRFLEILTHLPRGTVCVLETKETTLQGVFFEKTASFAKVTFFREPKGAELFSWIDRRAAFYEKKIPPAAKQLLLEKTGWTLSTLDKALEALATYVGKKPLIGEEEIKALLGTSLTHSSFELARAVASREALKALTIFSRLLSEKERPYEIVGAVGWQLRRMLRAKELLEEGVSPRDVGRQLRIRWEEEKTFFECLSRFERSELETGLRELLKVDHHLKTGVGQGREEVERFVLELCR